MKNHLLHQAVIAILSTSALVRGFSCYNKNSQSRFTSRGDYRRRHQKQQHQCQGSVDKVFEDLKREVNDNNDVSTSSPFANGLFLSPPATQENRRIQKQWINKAIDFAQGLNSELTSSEKEAQRIEENMQQFRDLVNYVYDFDESESSESEEKKNACSSSYKPTSISPRFQVQNTDEVFEVAVDMPGVEKQDIDVSVEGNGNILKIEAIRVIPFSGGSNQEECEAVNDDKTANTNNSTSTPSSQLSSVENLSKSFVLDDNVETERVSAKLNNGVLFVSFPKYRPEKPQSVKIPVNVI